MLLLEINLNLKFFFFLLFFLPPSLYRLSFQRDFRPRLRYSRYRLLHRRRQRELFLHRQERQRPSPEQRCPHDVSGGFPQVMCAHLFGSESEIAYRLVNDGLCIMFC